MKYSPDKIEISFDSGEADGYSTRSIDMIIISKGNIVVHNGKVPKGTTTESDDDPVDKPTGKPEKKK